MRHVALAASAILSCVDVPASGQVPSPFESKVEAKITAGLDLETRRVLERLPEKARKEALKFLAEALPRVDKSIEKHMEALDARLRAGIELALDDASCASQGVVRGIFEAMKDVVLGQPPHPVTQVANDWKNEGGRYSRWDTPETYSNGYADFLARTSVIACQVRKARASVDTIRSIEESALPRWRVWRRVQGHCDSASRCLDWARSHVEELVAVAHEGDVRVSQARKTLSEVRKPEPSVLPGSFRQAPYEDAMIRLLRAADAIELARVGRELRAEKSVQEVTATLDSVRPGLNAIKRHLDEVDEPKCVMLASYWALDAQATLRPLAQRLSEAEGLSSTTRDDVAVERSRLELYERQVTQYIERAATMLDAASHLPFAKDTCNGTLKRYLKRRKRRQTAEHLERALIGAHRRPSAEARLDAPSRGPRS